MMVDCKECICYEACEALARYYDDKDFPFGNCQIFKPKSRFIELPCAVGDTVYTNTAMQGWYYRDKDRPYSAKIVFIGLNNSEEMGGGLFNVEYEKDGNMLQFRFSDIGKTVFLTKEKAEKALKALEERY
jgi:hypothetical protein